MSTLFGKKKQQQRENYWLKIWNDAEKAPQMDMAKLKEVANATINGKKATNNGKTFSAQQVKDARAALRAQKVSQGKVPSIEQGLAEVDWSHGFGIVDDGVQDTTTTTPRANEPGAAAAAARSTTVGGPGSGRKPQSPKPEKPKPLTKRQKRDATVAGRKNKMAPMQTDPFGARGSPEFAKSMYKAEQATKKRKKSEKPDRAEELTRAAATGFVTNTGKILESVGKYAAGETSKGEALVAKTAKWLTAPIENSVPSKPKKAAGPDLTKYGYIKPKPKPMGDMKKKRKNKNGTYTPGR